MIQNRLNKIVSISLLSLLLVSPALAHVVVKPNQVGVGAFQTFTVGVPNEKDVPVTALRLLIPSGLSSVSPTVKPGWKIQVTKSEIIWTGGIIPAGERDDFTFSAQVPAEPTTLQWKAYQTYQGGEVVSWDQPPVTNQSDEDREKMEQQGVGPYSETTIINDLTTLSSASTTQPATTDRRALVISSAALALSLLAFGKIFTKQ